MMGYGGMMGGFGYGGSGIGMLWQIIWLVIIIAVIYALVSQFGRNEDKRTTKGHRAFEILRERLARGEIDYDEYVRMRQRLRD